jgi:hypothetical protein
MEITLLAGRKRTLNVTKSLLEQPASPPDVTRRCYIRLTLVAGMMSSSFHPRIRRQSKRRHVMVVEILLVTGAAEKSRIPSHLRLPQRGEEKEGG